MTDLHIRQESPPPAGAQSESPLRLLSETGLLLASHRSIDAIVQAALDAGLHLCHAKFGAFFYNDIAEEGPAGGLYKVAGPNLNLFAALSSLRPAEVFNVKFFGRDTVRSDDITLDPRYAQNPLFAGITPERLPIRSYLAVPVRTRTGNVFGRLLYGDIDAGVFTAGCEDLVATIASQAAVAIDNVSLSESLTREIAHVDAARTLQRETSNRLRQALDAAQLGTWTWDRASDLLDLDDRAAGLLHAQPHVPIALSALRERIVAAEDRLRTAESLARSFDQGSLHSAEYRVISPEGIQTWVSASGISTFASGSSEITGMAGTVQDITSRKNQESALRQSEKLAATGRLAATIAHEINNPLEAVTNLIYLSRTDPGVPAPVQSLLETADTELARVAQIAQQTLGFYRDTTRPIEIDLNELLHSVVSLFARKMVSHKITCTLDLDPGLCIHGLQGEIRQIFSNLMVNAIDAFNFESGVTGGAIHIRGRHLRGPRNGVSVLVCDQGSGIPASVRQRIFSPFFTTKQSVGTGLGLWVTRGFAEKHGGSIHFRTRTATPSGTIFRVFLPVNTPSTLLQPSGSAPQSVA